MDEWKTAGGDASAVCYLFAGQAQFMAQPGYPPTQVPGPWVTARIITFPSRLLAAIRV